MPEKMNINYDERMATEPRDQREVREVKMGGSKPSIVGDTQSKPPPVSIIQTQQVSKKVASLLDEDEEEPPQLQVQKPQETVQSHDPFDILGLDIGGGSQPPPPQPPKNNGGDLLGGFSFDQPSQPPQHSISTLSNPSNSQQAKGGDLLDGDFFGSPNLAHHNSQTHSDAPKHPVNNNQSIGFDFLGGGSTQPAQQTYQQPAQSVQQQPTQPQQNFSKPPQNNDTFKFKAYENPQVEIWMEGKREGEGNTKITASFINRTQSYVEQLSLQSAVMKYLKIAINPLTGTSLPPSSKGAVTQFMQVTNSAVGEKPIVMKVKLGYTINGQKQAFEAKIDGFPLGF